MADRTLATIESLLTEDLPRSAVQERRGAGSQTLSYVSQHYVRTRLIEVFGPLGFDLETTMLECIGEEEVDTSNGKRWTAAYRSTVRLTVRADQPFGMHVSVKMGSGWGTGMDKSRLGAHEKALKEAETDAMKRACILLGPSMGLALYDKEQNDVAEDVPGKAPAGKKARRAKKAATGPSAFDDLKAMLAAGTADGLEAFKEGFVRARADKAITKEQNAELTALFLVATAQAKPAEGVVPADTETQGS